MELGIGGLTRENKLGINQKTGPADGSTAVKKPAVDSRGTTAAKTVVEDGKASKIGATTHGSKAPVLQFRPPTRSSRENGTRGKNPLNTSTKQTRSGTSKGAKSTNS